MQPISQPTLTEDLLGVWLCSRCSGELKHKEAVPSIFLSALILKVRVNLFLTQHSCSPAALHGGTEQLQGPGDKGAAPPIPLAACLQMQTTQQFIELKIEARVE